MMRRLIAVWIGMAALTAPAWGRPAFVKAATFHETVETNLQALGDWTALYDVADAKKSVGLTTEPWQIAGPIPAGSALFESMLSSYGLVDCSRPLSDATGTYPWRAAPEFADGRVGDLTAFAGAKAGDTFILVRAYHVAPDYKPFGDTSYECSLAAGYTEWRPGRNKRDEQFPWPLLEDGQHAPFQPGTNQFLMWVRPDAAGRRLFFYRLRNCGPKSPANDNPWVRSEYWISTLLDALHAWTGNPEAERRAAREMEYHVWFHERSRFYHVPGFGGEFIDCSLRQGAERMLAAAASRLAETQGLAAAAVAVWKPAATSWLARASSGAARTPGETLFARADALLNLLDLSAAPASLRLAVDDQIKLFGSRYPQGPAALERIGKMEQETAALWKRFLAGEPGSGKAIAAFTHARCRMQEKMLLDTPLLDFRGILLARGRTSLNSNFDGANHIGDELVALEPARPDGKVTVIHRGAVSDFDLNWDGRRLLYSDGVNLHELDLAVTNVAPRLVTREAPKDVLHYDGCYLPDGKIVCACNACWQVVPCVGHKNVGNLHLLDADGSHERRLTFDQDHSWNPSVMNDGRVLFTRWEYEDVPHYFARLLMRMKPDGSGQMEFYGSNSYWPNSMFWPRAIPGDPYRIVCVVSGHHGVARAGWVTLFDPRRGRHETAGAVQRLPGYGQAIPNVIQDQLLRDVWPLYAAPYPLAEGPDNRGAGRYFLACRQVHELAGWELCLMDVYDNVTPILKAGTGADGQPVSWMAPVPWRTRVTPPSIVSTLDLTRKDAVIYLSDIYAGEGLRGYPRGSIRALRLGVPHYRYFCNGSTHSAAYEGGWDVKRILGTVKVNPDGSAIFRIPANTPIFVQPLDAEGKAQALMRSWYTAMPGEVGSCVGCHETQNSAAISQLNAAGRSAPQAIEPWHGPARGFSFEREIQPILNRRCVGCHDGRNAAVEDFRDKRIRPPEQDKIPPSVHWFGWLASANPHLKKEPDFFSPSYMRLQKYIRRAGLEADYHLAAPAEFEADTSALVQMLKKGHHNVKLAEAEWSALYTWIDFNIPYAGRWRDSCLPPSDEDVAIRRAFQKRYAALDDRNEEPIPVPPIEAFEAPVPETPIAAGPAVDGWPFPAKDAEAHQRQASAATMLSLDLGDGVTMTFRRIPAGRFVMGHPSSFPDERPVAAAVGEPFYLGEVEVTQRQFRRFDPRHDNGYIEGRDKDRTTRGYPINEPDSPVVRVSWNEAVAFCDWLTKRSGRHCSLPTETEWEWACRAGAATDFPQGTAPAAANLADESIRQWNYGRAERGYSDGAPFLVPGRKYAANAWGLFDMIGNAAEWTASAYSADGLDKVVRGGSWNDTARYANAASRWRHKAFQPVYNVGFRVKAEVR